MGQKTYQPGRAPIAVNTASATVCQCLAGDALEMFRRLIQVLRLRAVLLFSLALLIGTSSVPTHAGPFVGPVRDPGHGFHFVDEASHAGRLPQLTPIRNDIARQGGMTTNLGPAAGNPVLKREIFGFAPY